MLFLRTLGWLLCVLYSTIPLFWLMVHPRAHIWREKQRSPFRVLVPAWIVMWFGVGAITQPWHSIALYSTPWSWIPAAFLFTTGISLYAKSGKHFSWAQLGGLPEVRGNVRRENVRNSDAGNKSAGSNHAENKNSESTSHDQHLVTTGIRAHVRHPVYLAHLCEMLAWSIGTGLAVCWLLTAFAVLTGAIMIRMEDAELEKRFGEEYAVYRNHVPAVLPRF
jgi:hypothetical protein